MTMNEWILLLLFHVGQVEQINEQINVYNNIVIT